MFCVCVFILFFLLFYFLHSLRIKIYITQWLLIDPVHVPTFTSLSQCWGSVSLQDYTYGRLLPETLQLADVQLVVVNEAIVSDVKYRTNDIILTRDKCCGENVEFCIVKEIAVCASDAYLVCTSTIVEFF